MDYRNLGWSGLRVSAVGLGCNNFGGACDQAATQAVVDKAIDLGVTLFDTADMYGKGDSEVYLGKALGPRRKDVIIGTKFGWPVGDKLYPKGGGSRQYIMRTVEGSLMRLGTDYIDLYQLHNPDPATPVAETLRALDDLISQGKVRYIGHSNFTGALTVEATLAARAGHFEPFMSAQNRYSLLTRDIEQDLIPACQTHGVGIVPFFPLESGLLTGKYRRGAPPPKGTRWDSWLNRQASVDRFFTDDKFAKVEKLEALAAKAGCSLLDMAMGWLLSRPMLSSVIAGATKPEQVEANIKAAEWRPTAEVNAAIDAVTKPGPRA
jgi:aryl-alcohol dehydrogenase-like predicted oxidoreductase